MKNWSEIFHFLIVCIVALLLVSDVFLFGGRPITFDSQVHMVTMTQFAQAMRAGDWPVTWVNNFANYGLPLGIVAHQTTSYLGGLFVLLTNNTPLAYNLVLLIGSLFSSAVFYVFCRQFYPKLPSMVAGVLFSLAPYRIINIYTRGALPEFFASGFTITLMLGIWLQIKKKHPLAWLIVLLSVALLTLTHPMMLLMSVVVAGPFALLTWWPTKKWQDITILAGAGILGLIISSYYLVPLFIETKYFNYGILSTHYSAGKFLNLNSFISADWYYFLGHPGPRGDFMKTGIIETAVVIFGLGLMWLNQKSGAEKKTKLWWWLAILALVTFFLLPISEIFYLKIGLFNSLQYPSRFLSMWLIFAPLVLAEILTRWKDKWLTLVILLVIILARYPQIYSKNVVSYGQSGFEFMRANLHTDNMNTIWMGSSNSYAIKSGQYEVIGGQGQITPLKLSNSYRMLKVSSPEGMRIADHSFYFPGWRIWIDQQPGVIEFQDPEFRGVVTYQVPAGEHTVKLEFGPTKLRLLAYLLSIAGLGLLSCILIAQAIFFVRRNSASKS